MMVRKPHVPLPMPCEPTCPQLHGLLALERPSGLDSLAGQGLHVLLGHDLPPSLGEAPSLSGCDRGSEVVHDPSSPSRGEPLDLQASRNRPMVGKRRRSRSAPVLTGPWRPSMSRCPRSEP